MRWIRVDSSAPTGFASRACEQHPAARRARRVDLGRPRDRDLQPGGDRFLATDNQCPHKGGPLADGIVTGTSVVCPLHAWKINLEDGRVERPSGSSAIRA